MAIHIDIGVTVQAVSFINEDILRNECELWRLDDNNNEFLMSEYSTIIEAELHRKAFQDKGHKQIYFVKSKNSTESE